MSGITPAFANDLLELIFNGTPIANIADNAASSPLTIWELSLHSAKPTTGQDHNEVTYTGYGRIALVRTSGAFVVTGDSVSPVADILFGTCTAGVMSATYLGIGTAHTGAGQLKFAFAISPAVSIFPGQVPRIKNTSVISMG
jgi:hypothetical protein